MCRAALALMGAVLAVVMLLTTLNHTAGAAEPADDEASESDGESNESDQSGGQLGSEQPAARSQLRPGEWLSPGESLFSANGGYQLILRPDGNLALHEVGQSAARWTSRTSGDSDRILVMQADGNLVLYELPITPFQALWHSETHGQPGAFLEVRDNGTATIGFDDGRTIWTAGNATLDSVLASTKPVSNLDGVKYVLYERGAQRVSLIEADGSVFDSYPVSGRATSPFPGTYAVYSKSPQAWSYGGGATMNHMVRFAHGVNGGRIGFHSIPTNGRGEPIQTEAELGQFRSAGCVRQRNDKAAQLYEWAPLGTPVVVLA